MTGFDAVWESVSGVEGWMSRDQARALYEAAAACPSGGTIVEIGSFRGRSTIVLASAAPSGATVVAIDPHAGNDRGPRQIGGFEREAADDHAAFGANLARAAVAGRVTHLRLTSADALAAVDGPVDVLHVDGAHRYGPARADVREWGARVGDGGTMLIHDAFSSIGVTLAILRELSLGRRFRYIGRRRSLAVYRADLDGGRWRNALRQGRELGWFARNLGLKLVLAVGVGRLLGRLGRPVPEWPY